MKVLTEFKLMTLIGTIIIVLLNVFLSSFGFDGRYLGFSMIECAMVIMFYSAMIEKYFILKEKKK
jgi:O-antigen/teichoic acid export membrane protein